LGRARDYDAAQQQLQAALESDPTLADAHELLANLLMARNQAAAALSHYRAWVGLQPESAQAQFGLGSALAMTGDRAGAIPHLRRAVAGGDAGTRDAATRLLRELGVVPQLETTPGGNWAEKGPVPCHRQAGPSNLRQSSLRTTNGP
jgi:tetratricopeptide (TPR) repeat protein